MKFNFVQLLSFSRASNRSSLISRNLRSHVPYHRSRIVENSNYSEIVITNGSFINRIQCGMLLIFIVSSIFDFEIWLLSFWLPSFQFQTTNNRSIESPSISHALIFSCSSVLSKHFQDFFELLRSMLEVSELTYLESSLSKVIVFYLCLELWFISVSTFGAHYFKVKPFK